MEGELRAQAAAELEAGREAEAMDWNAVLAAVFLQQGRHDDALLLQEKVLDVLRRVLPEDDPKIGELHKGCVIDCMFDCDAFGMVQDRSCTILHSRTLLLGGMKMLWY